MSIFIGWDSTRGTTINVGAPGGPPAWTSGGVDWFELLLYGLQFRSALRRLRAQGLSGELRTLLIVEAVGNPDLRAELPLATVHEAWEDLLLMGLTIVAAAKRLKAQGLSGTVRTMIAAQSVENPTVQLTVPFITIHV